MIDKIKKFQKKPPDKWYDELYNFEMKVMKWIADRTKPKLKDELYMKIRLKKIKKKRRSCEIGNE
jgi:hypothetical protein